MIDRLLVNGTFTENENPLMFQTQKNSAQGAPFFRAVAAAVKVGEADVPVTYENGLPFGGLVEASFQVHKFHVATRQLAQRTDFYFLCGKKRWQNVNTSKL